MRLNLMCHQNHGHLPDVNLNDTYIKKNVNKELLVYIKREAHGSILDTLHLHCR